MLVAFATILSIVILDQGLKAWIVATLPLGAQVPLWPGVLSLTHIRNQGASWGLFAGMQGLLIGVTVLAIGFFGYKIIRRQASSVWVNLAYGLLVGGALGNLIDRVWQGYVVDMLQTDFMRFPIFNVADSALTVGVILLIICAREADLTFYH